MTSTPHRIERLVETRWWLAPGGFMFARVLEFGFRSLYERMVSYDGDSLFEDVLAPAIPDAINLMELLSPLRSLRTAPRGTCSDERLWELFALSVVNDCLLLPQRVSAKEYRAFFTALGFEIPISQPSQAFDPLFHEICGAGVGTWVPKDNIVLGRHYWPLVRFGEMVFSRAGVDVRCRPEHGIVKAIAERSTLYFANDRFNRPARDLSHDWGSNSRWRTRFARSYRTSAYSIFNADGKFDLSGPVAADSGPSSQSDLPIAARRELLVNRCFVSYMDHEVDGDRFPYDDVLVVRVPSGWPLDEHALVPLDGLAL